MFFDKRKRCNGNVAVLLRQFGIDVNEAPFAVLTVLDHAWLSKFSTHEGALLVAYSHATALYKSDVSQADSFTMTRLYPLQLDWLNSRLVRADIIEPMTRILKQRAHDAYGATGRDEASSPTPPRSSGRDPSSDPVARRRPPPAPEPRKPWIFNRKTGQLIRRETGDTFGAESYYRDGPGYVIRDKRFPWASDREIEVLG